MFMAERADKSKREVRPLLDGSAVERWWLFVAGGVTGLAATMLYLLRRPAQGAGRIEMATHAAAESIRPRSQEEIASGGERIGGSEEPHGPVHFESTDIGCAGGCAALASYAAVVAIGCLCAWWLFSATFFRHRKATYGEEQVAAPAPFPPQPRLEPLIVDDTRMSADYWAREHERGLVLDTYGSTKEEGYVHIPIEQAMRLAVKQLPVRQESQAATAKSRGLFTGGESNSGRVYRTTEQ
jgi:hypothetical protein